MAVRLTASNSAFKIPLGSGSFPTAFTVGGWFYLNGAPNGTYLSLFILSANNGYGSGYQVYLTGASHLVSSYQDAGGPFTEGGPAVALSTWTHVCAVHTGNTYTPYVNGVAVAAGQVLTTATPIATPDRAIFGNDYGGSWGDLSVRNAFAVDRALSAAEIGDLMLRTRPRIALHGYVPAFDTAALQDWSGNGHTGTLEGTTSTYTGEPPVAMGFDALHAFQPAAAGASPQTATAGLSLATWTQLSPTATPGGVTAAAGLSTATWAHLSPTVVAAITVTGALSSAAWTHLAATATPGGVTVTADLAAQTWTGISATTAQGAVTATTDLSVATWAHLTASVAVALTVTTTTSAATWTHVNATTAQGAVTAMADLSVSTWAGLTATASAGIAPIQVTAGLSLTTWTGITASVATGGVTVTVALAVQTWGHHAAGVGATPIDVTTGLSASTWTHLGATGAAGATTVQAALGAATWTPLTATVTPGAVGVTPGLSGMTWTGLVATFGVPINQPNLRVTVGIDFALRATTRVTPASTVAVNGADAYTCLVEVL